MLYIVVLTCFTLNIMLLSIIHVAVIHSLTTIVRIHFSLCMYISGYRPGYSFPIFTFFLKLLMTMLWTYSLVQFLHLKYGSRYYGLACFSFIFLLFTFIHLPSYLAEPRKRTVVFPRFSCSQEFWDGFLCQIYSQETSIHNWCQGEIFYWWLLAEATPLFWRWQHLTLACAFLW